MNPFYLIWLIVFEGMSCFNLMKPNPHHEMGMFEIWFDKPQQLLQMEIFNMRKNRELE